MIIYFGNNHIPFTFSQQQLPNVNDPSLKIDRVADGLQSPTSMAFLTNNSLLIAQKEGTLSMLDLNNPTNIEPILELSNVNSKNERGLLGITIDNNKSGESSIFLYVTETRTQLDQETQDTASNDDLRNRVYKYEWDEVEQRLSNPKIILDLPAGPGTNHQGGKIKIGPDNQLYVVIGELQREGQLQNFREGPEPDDSGVIFRVNPVDGSPSNNNPFIEANNGDKGGNNNLLAKYYAYGIRNSFGFDFDPITGKLWDTENGENLYDEINIVESGFNSGWKLIMGPFSKSEAITENDLVNFQGSHYSDPLLSWEQSRGITDLEFFKSDNLGQKYANNIFVGDITRGNLFFLQVNENRNGLQFDNEPNIANDHIASSEEEISSITLGTGFKGITDVETGPDGNLYILTYSRADGGQGALYRISENTTQ
ncbi:PQQ-dependent sugar dehydrogenase [Candidatus Nitrosocosmicus agrestis]|uniref:PQQ-dependent sugar dehydrogenase n=1 Tax=Candidatus Nitrosocosmicus agrestis TaxID=2563600 RepID=UPI0013312F56|nr:PQQ-dependent sugar dehydrogenase [Candidatus Nitrosocosmicus sp. SS]